MEFSAFELFHSFSYIYIYIYIEDFFLNKF